MTQWGNPTPPDRLNPVPGEHSDVQGQVLFELPKVSRVMAQEGGAGRGDQCGTRSVLAIQGSRLLPGSEGVWGRPQPSLVLLLARCRAS